MVYIFGKIAKQPTEHPPRVIILLKVKGHFQQFLIIKTKKLEEFYVFMNVIYEL